MKLKNGVIAVLVIVLSMSVVVPQAKADVDVSFDLFYSNLTPHGSWLVSAEYGRVWQPRVYARGWNPYYDGHWEYADVGWTWVSDYAWGGIPYHYGTWVLDPMMGWVWIPGYTWAPAWVVFRTGPDYIGWAPVAPSFALGMSFGSSAPVSASFLFVPTRDFCAPKVRSYVVPERDVPRVVARTTVVNNLVVQNNIVVNRGPDVRVVEAAAHKKIAVTPVESLRRVGPHASVRRDQLAIAPERAQGEVRAAEPFSAKRPLPSGKDRAALAGEPEPRARSMAQPATPEAQQPRAAQPEKQQIEKRQPEKQQTVKQQTEKQQKPKGKPPKGEPKSKKKHEEPPPSDPS